MRVPAPISTSASMIVKAPISTSAAIRAAGGESLALAHDVTREDQWQSVVQTTLAHYGRLDVLVNNAGIAVLKPLAVMSLADWNRQIEVNLGSTPKS